MPYTMTHLLVAHKVRNTLGVENLPQFYLGSLAPDAVHYRDGYTSELKKASHVRLSPVKWGSTEYTDEWRQDLLDFWHQHEHSSQRDFILGYCVHILTDLYNANSMWGKFLLRYPDDRVRAERIYRRENEIMDDELHYTHSELTAQLWEHLRNSVGVSVEPLIFAMEIEQQKEHILNGLYTGRQRHDVSQNVDITYESMIEFIENAAAYVLGVFAPTPH